MTDAVRCEPAYRIGQAAEAAGIAGCKNFSGLRRISVSATSSAVRAYRVTANPLRKPGTHASQCFFDVAGRSGERQPDE
jgi:hypothetical protein